MNFLLSSQQREIQDAVQRLLGERCGSARLHEVFDGESGFDAPLWRALCEMGAPGLLVPEGHGGSGLEMIDFALVAEACGAAAAPVPLIEHGLAALAIVLAGSDAQRARWLPRMARGELIGTVAWAEGAQQWQPSEWSLAPGATLSGRKPLVPFASQAGLFVVGLAGGGLAVVEAGAPGLSISAVDSLDRTRRFSVLGFDATPADLLAGGFEYANRVRDAALVLLAADAFGGAARLVDMAVEYAKTRQQFGVPIGRFQGLKHQIANMAVDVEPARGLYWFAAHAFDHVPGEAVRAAALAKAHLADRYLQAARDTVEAHGGIGYTWEYDAQVYVKRALFDGMVMGAPALHRARAAELAGW